jgi:integrase
MGISALYQLRSVSVRCVVFGPTGDPLEKMRQPLTAAKLQNLKPPASGFLELHDDKVRGLSLRVFASGQKTWALRYRPKGGAARRRIGLGNYPTIGLAKARDRAECLRGDISGGADPQRERQVQRDALTVAELTDRYMAERVRPKKKARTVELYAHYFANKLGAKLKAKKAYDVTVADIDRLHRRLGEQHQVTANRVVVALSGVYAFAIRQGLVPDDFKNPCRSVEKFREQGRERYLLGDELARLGEALRNAEKEGLRWPENWGGNSKHGYKPENRKTQFTPHVAAAFRLLLFTGCRLREILHLRWSEVDLERGLLLLSDSKTGRKTVVLNAPALEVLIRLPRLGDFVILGDHPRKPRADLKRSWELLQQHACIPDVRIHDLRHTHASIGAGAGLGLPIIGKLLGHKHHETTQRYAHLDADPLRRASNRIGSEIAVALGEMPLHDNVERIRHPARS